MNTINWQATFEFIAIAGAVLWLVAAYLWIAIKPQHKLPRNRARRQAWRLHLRMHPGAGLATVGELWWHWSKTSTYRKSKRSRPDLTRRQRIRHPRLHSVFIGRAQWRHALRILAELHVLILSPPRKGKTAFLARVLIRYPGPVVNTTVKADIFKWTSKIRARLGRIHVFNPQGIGGIPSTFAMDPVEGCMDVEIAIRRAQVLVSATSSGDTGEKGGDSSDWFKDKVSDILAGLLHAAALLQADFRLVAQWVYEGTEGAERALGKAEAYEMRANVHELDNSPAEKTRATFMMMLHQILGFLAIPELAKCVLPKDGSAFDLDAFCRSMDTLYMITDSDQEQSPIAPINVLILDEVKRTATAIGQKERGGRLVRPLGFLLDEVRQCAPAPLQQWLASTGGLGLQIFAVFHGESQMRSRWGDDQAQTIMDCCDVKMLLPGVTDASTLRNISEALGQVALHPKGNEVHSSYPILDQGMIRSIPDCFGLILRGNRSPVIARLPRIWYAYEFLFARFFLGGTTAELEPVQAYTDYRSDIKITIPEAWLPQPDGKPIAPDVEPAAQADDDQGDEQEAA
jgi:type IV secretion system protein VirD4